MPCLELQRGQEGLRKKERKYSKKIDIRSVLKIKNNNENSDRNAKKVVYKDIG